MTRFFARLAVVALLTLPVLAAAGAERKSPADLPSIAELPDPLMFADGSKVQSREQWSKRRAELQELILTYEYGHIPPAAPVSAAEQPWKPVGAGAEKGEAKRAEKPVPLPPGATETQWVLKTGPEGKIAIPLVLTRPAGKGPFPVIIRGDLCWGRVSTEIAAEVVGRGYALAEFDRTAIVPDENVGREVGLYGLYPEYDSGALAAWAWGYHRVVDYLLTRDDIQKDHLAITGHSRGGKTALLAGATDERIALTAPNNSGCGGAGCFRFSADKSETIDVITKRFPYWFQPKFAEFIGRLDRLPIDQHSVKALVAPRALLTTEALGDLWANPEGAQHTHVAAKKVFEFLGTPDKTGIVYREGGHEQGIADWRVLLDFADAQFFGKKVDRKFDQLPFADQPASVSAPAAASDWPQFRGPKGDGTSSATGVPVKWGEDKNVAWKTPIPGRAWSSPVILGKQVWLTTASPDGRKLSVLCIDKETGKIVRDQKVFDVEKPQYAHPFNSYASPTPVVEAGRVYVSYGSPGIACLDSETGKVIWERRDFVCNHYRGAGSSPVIHNDLLILNFDGSDFQYVAAVDKATGKTRWKTDRSIDYQDLDENGKVQREGDMRKAFSTPRISTLSGKPVLLSLGSKAFYAYDPADGKEVWRIENRSSHSGSSTPFVGDKFAYFCTGLGNEQLWAVKPGGTGVLSDAQIAWKVKKNVPGKPSPVMVDGRIYMTDDAGVASCVDAATGAEIFRDRLKGNYSASPVAADGKVYFFSEDGVATVIEAGTKFKVLAENELEDGFMASPAVADRTLYLRTTTSLYRIK